MAATQLALQGPAKALDRLLVVEGEHHRGDRGRPVGVAAHGLAHGRGRVLQGDPADAGAQGGQGHAGQPLGGGQTQGGGGGAAHGGGAGRPAGGHGGGVQDRLDPAVTEAAGPGPDGVPHRPGRLGLGLDLVAGGPADGPGDPRAQPALVVGRVDDRLGVGGGDVALPHPDLGRPAAGHPATLLHPALRLQRLLAPPYLAAPAQRYRAWSQRSARVSTVRSRSRGSLRTARRYMVCSAMAARAVAAVRGSTGRLTPRPAACSMLRAIRATNWWRTSSTSRPSSGSWIEASVQRAIRSASRSYRSDRPPRTSTRLARTSPGRQGWPARSTRVTAFSETRAARAARLFLK